MLENVQRLQDLEILKQDVNQQDWRILFQELQNPALSKSRLDGFLKKSNATDVGSAIINIYDSEYWGKRKSACFIKEPRFLLRQIELLRENVSSAKQYEILRKTVLLLEKDDAVLFVNMLCNGRGVE